MCLCVRLWCACMFENIIIIMEVNCSKSIIHHITYVEKHSRDARDSQRCQPSGKPSTWLPPGGAEHGVRLWGLRLWGVRLWGVRLWGVRLWVRVSGVCVSGLFVSGLCVSGVCVSGVCVSGECVSGCTSLGCTSLSVRLWVCVSGCTSLGVHL